MMVAGFSSFMVGPDRDAATAMGAPQDPFRSALASGYKSLGANQYAEADYVSADIYYRKAQAAAAGRAVPREGPARWTLADVDRQQVAAMRPGLQSWIDTNSQRDPQGTAAQQLRFDCWIEELHEGEYADANACKPGALAQAPAPVAGRHPRRHRRRPGPPRRGPGPGRGRRPRPRRHRPERQAVPGRRHLLRLGSL